MMKVFHKMLLSLVPVFAAMTFLNLDAFAQDQNPPSVPDRMKDLDIEIPFIDRDGDGINDLVQNGWGLRFLNRYKKRQELWDMLNVEIVKGEDGKRMVDTDGDGEGDIAFRDFMAEQMERLIDTDGDGVPDKPLREYLGRRFQSFDGDGDGLPDEFTREKMKAFIDEMKEWRKHVRDRMNQGLPPFVDENGDGIPDNLPPGFGRRRGH